MPSFKLPPPQTTHDPHERLDDLERRLVRIETRLTRLMQHFGLRADGSPRVPQSTQRDAQ